MKTKNSKKVLALILSFFMILTVLPFNVMAEGEEVDPALPVAELATPGTEPAKAPEPTPADNEEAKKIEEAKKLVETAKEAKTKEAYDAAKKAVDALKDGEDKTALLDSLKKVDEAIKAAEKAAELDEAKKEAKDAITAEATKATDVINKIADPTKKDEQETSLNTAVAAANKAIDAAPTTEKVAEEQKSGEAAIKTVVDAAQKIVNEEKAAEEAKKIEEAKKLVETAKEAKTKEAYDAAKKAVDALKDGEDKTALQESLKKVDEEIKAAEKAAATQLSFKSYNVYYDAITGKVVDGNNNPVKDALVKVLGRTTYTDKDGNFTFNMTSESGNYYCGYYGYYWKDYPYNSYKLTTNTGSYFGSNGSYARYYFLVDGYGNIVDSVYAAANSSFTLHGESDKVYTVYYSDYGYGYGYGYPYYDKYYNRYYNPTTSWAKDQKLTASKTDYKEASVTLGYVTNNSWLYTTCYEYGYKYYYGYDRVIYPSQLSLSGNGTIVSGKVGVSYLPIYVYRNGVFLGSGNADVNGYFSIGLNSRVSSTSDLTFYAYGKGKVAPEKKSEKADHGVIPVKSTVVIGSTKLIKNINGVEADVNMDVAPFIKDGRTMLPLRYIAEALGFKVDWDRATRTVTLTDKEFKVQIPVETNKIIVNGSTYYSDANPVLRNGRTMLPVANIARALGLKDGTDILWDANTRVATITRLVKY